MQIALLLLNFLIMVFMPVLFGWFIARRCGISWRFFGIGAMTFVQAQLAHVPFNYLVLNNLFPEATSISRSSMLVLTAAFLGLSAGLSEEGARTAVGAT